MEWYDPLKWHEKINFKQNCYKQLGSGDVQMLRAAIVGLTRIILQHHVHTRRLINTISLKSTALSVINPCFDVVGL